MHSTCPTHRSLRHFIVLFDPYIQEIFISMNVLYRLASMMVTDCSLCGRNWNFVCKLDCQSSDVRGRDGYSPVSHREDPVSILGLSVWDWQWTCGTVAGVSVLRPPPSELFHQCSIFLFILIVLLLGLESETYKPSVPFSDFGEPLDSNLTL